jgi:hypothetical protein
LEEPSKVSWPILASVVVGNRNSANQLCVYIFIEIYQSYLKQQRIVTDDQGEEDNIYFPSLESIEQWRDNDETWLWAMKNFLLYVEPSRKERVKHDLMSNWCTVSSEAILCVLLENSYDLWTQEVKHPRTDPFPGELIRKVSKWTSNGNSGVKFKGWDDRGISRFNELGEIIQQARKQEDTGELLELSFKEEMQDMRGGNKKRKRTNERGVEPRYDLPEGFQLHAC